MKGFSTCPNWLKRKYLEAANYKCQRCGSKSNLEIHRIKRGNNGGLYTVCPLNHPDNNIKVVCSECHRLFHGNESRRVNGK